MKRSATLAAAILALCLACAAAPAQEVVHFPSFEDNGAGQPSTQLDGYLFRPACEDRHPAIVGLHGCSGMFIRGTSTISPIYRAWGAELVRHGFAFLLVDSFGPRGITTACGSVTGTRPIFRQLFRKMSAKRGEMIAWNP